MIPEGTAFGALTLCHDLYYRLGPVEVECACGAWFTLLNARALRVGRAVCRDGAHPAGPQRRAPRPSPLVAASRRAWKRLRDYAYRLPAARRAAYLCAAWAESRDRFVRDVGAPPAAAGWRLVRRDASAPWGPGNAVWQQLDAVVGRPSPLVRIGDREVPRAVALAALGISRQAFWKRLKRMSVEEALALAAQSVGRCLTDSSAPPP